LTARYRDWEQTAEAGGALIVRPGERFELIAQMHQPKPCA
jgi:hypothetical protein